MFKYKIGEKVRLSRELEERLRPHLTNTGLNDLPFNKRLQIIDKRVHAGNNQYRIQDAVNWIHEDFLEYLINDKEI